MLYVYNYITQNTSSLNQYYFSFSSGVKAWKKISQFKITTRECYVKEDWLLVCVNYTEEDLFILDFVNLKAIFNSDVKEYVNAVNAECIV